MKKILAALAIMGLSTVAMAGTPAPEGAKVYFISPTDGATVDKTFKVQFGLSGMGVAPAGTDKANTGHHHLVINGDTPKSGVPMGADVKHFGGGQTEAEVTLEPGSHTLQLVLGDMAHVPHEPPVVSDKITITVK